MPNTENRKNSNKKPTLQEHSQTVIIPQLTPEMLEQARRAAEQGKTAEQIEQEAKETFVPIIRKETQSWKWTALAAVLPTVVGVLFCMVFANAARLFL